MPNAARQGTPIGHSPTMSWLVKGLLIGAAVGIGVVAVVGTGGLAGAAIIGGLVAGGAGIGEVLSTMSWAPKDTCGTIITGAPNVLINNMPAACAHVDTTKCSKHSGKPVIAQGSATVFINNMPAARINDKISCGAVIVEGSPNVIIEGGTVQTDNISPENLVPSWVHWALLGIGLASACILAGPVVAVLGLVGGVAGGAGGGWLGGKIFGEGSDRQKYMMLGGAFIGGAVGAKGGAWFNKNYTITTQGLGSNLGNVKVQKALPEGMKATNNKAIREWYNEQTAPEKLDGLNRQWEQEGVSLKERSENIFNIRHDARLTSREYMQNVEEVEALRSRDMAKYGSPDGPTFPQEVQKYIDQGMTENEAYQAVIDGASRTSSEYNAKFGIKR